MNLGKLRFFFFISGNCQLVFSSENKVPQLGSAWLGTFTARLGSSRKILARAHQKTNPKGLLKTKIFPDKITISHIFGSQTLGIISQDKSTKPKAIY
jgi:hypothetical protein